MTHLLSLSPTLIDVGDAQLSHRVMGDGPDVVFVHGWPLHGLTWRHVVQRLAEAGYRCHVFDLPGTGASKWTASTSFTIEAHAERLHRAVDHLGLSSFALVGHDSGATVSRHLAAALGDRVWANVVSGSEIPHHHPLLLKAMLAFGRLPGKRTGFRTLLRSRTLRRSTLGFGACFEDVDKAEGEFTELFARPLLEDDRAIDGQMGLVRDWDWAATDVLTELHPHIKGPTLLLWGDKDPYFPARHARRMASQFGGGARFVSRPDARLFVHEEHPDWFAAQTAGFFAQAQA